MLNDGLFRLNGRSGYVLKPQYLLSLSVARSPPVKVRINIISAHKLPKAGCIEVCIPTSAYDIGSDIGNGLFFFSL
jgi:hypothetical protein